MELRKRLFAAILRQETRWFDAQEDSSRLSDKLNSYSESLQSTVSSGFQQPITSVIVLLTAGSTVLLADPVLVLVGLAIRLPLWKRMGDHLWKFVLCAFTSMLEAAFILLADSGLV